MSDFHGPFLCAALSRSARKHDDPARGGESLRG